MPLPWLQIIDAVIGVTDLARSRKIRQMAAQQRPEGDAQQALEAGGRAGALGGLETRLAGVVVAALKEAFDRDSHRLELERAQLEAERERAERALRLELRRQAGDREIGRQRMLAGVAVASWIGTLFLAFFSRRLNGAGVIDNPVGARVALGGGWLLLLLAFASSFTAQSQIAEALARDEGGTRGGIAGDLALWFIVAGLVLVGLAVLVS
jgi:hypothetical protein